MKTILTAMFLTAVMLGICGCAAEEKPIVKLTGKVTTLDGPMKIGVVNFYSKETGQAVSANVNDGTYQATAQIPEGTYVVFFTPPLPSDPLPGKPAVIVELKGVPEKYQNERTSPLTVDVVAGAETLDLTITP